MPNSRRALTVALGLVAAGLVAAPSAHAALTTTVSRTGDAVVVRTQQDTNEALPQDGADNVITVAEAPDGGLQVTETGRGVGLVANAPCTLLAANTAVCPAFPGNDGRVEVTSGPGDDHVRINLSERNRAGVVRSDVNGGFGNDTLIGGDIADTLE